MGAAEGCRRRSRGARVPVADRRSAEQRNLFARVLKPAAKKAGVPWAGFHTLRHTCATTLFRNGLNAKQVQIWLGHHSPAFTMATYVHLLPDDLGDAAFLDALTSTSGTKAEEIAWYPRARRARSRVG